jgi:hypothetical protein
MTRTIQHPDKQFESKSVTGKRAQFPLISNGEWATNRLYDEAQDSMANTY